MRLESPPTVRRRRVLQSGIAAGLGAVGVRTASRARADGTNGATAAQRQFRAMSYNIHHGAGTDGVYDLRRVAGIVWSAAPDVVALQEVDDHFTWEGQSPGRSNLDDQPTLLADWLDMHVTFETILEYEPIEESNGEPRRYGLVVLSEYPILESNKYVLQDDHDKPLLAETKINVDGVHAWFYNLHLDAYDPALRAEQIDNLVEIVDRRDGPKVLAGDFNSFYGEYIDRDDSNYRTLNGEYVDALRETGADGPTYPAPGSDSHERRIDYVFTTEDVEARSGRVFDSVASDHKPLVADLTVSNATGAN